MTSPHQPDAGGLKGRTERVLKEGWGVWLRGSVESFSQDDERHTVCYTTGKREALRLLDDGALRKLQTAGEIDGAMWAGAAAEGWMVIKGLGVLLAHKSAGESVRMPSPPLQTRRGPAGPRAAAAKSKGAEAPVVAGAKRGRGRPKKVEPAPAPPPALALRPPPLAGTATPALGSDGFVKHVSSLLDTELEERTREVDEARAALNERESALGASEESVQRVRELHERLSPAGASAAEANRKLREEAEAAEAELEHARVHLEGVEAEAEQARARHAAADRAAKRARADAEASAAECARANEALLREIAAEVRAPGSRPDATVRATLVPAGDE